MHNCNVILISIVGQEYLSRGSRSKLQNPIQTARMLVAPRPNSTHSPAGRTQTVLFLSCVKLLLCEHIRAASERLLLSSTIKITVLIATIPSCATLKCCFKQTYVSAPIDKDWRKWLYIYIHTYGRWVITDVIAETPPAAKTIPRYHEIWEISLVSKTCYHHDYF